MAGGPEFRINKCFKFLVELKIMYCWTLSEPKRQQAFCWDGSIRYRPEFRQHHDVGLLHGQGHALQGRQGAVPLRRKFWKKSGKLCRNQFNRTEQFPTLIYNPQSKKYLVKTQEK